jgi:hypothetical protein
VSTVQACENALNPCFAYLLAVAAADVLAWIGVERVGVAVSFHE